MAPEPFAKLPEDIFKKILLQLPSPASLERAAFVSKYWGRIISSPAFLSRYRKLHPSSPLLGFFYSDREFGLPAFRLTSSVRSDPDLKAVLRVLDIALVDLEEDSGWRIRDSRNGHLLLCRAGKSGGDSFSIYNPVSRRLVTISADRPHNDVDYFADCLLLGNGDDDFRVVSVQQHGGQIRAVEYDPDARGWRSHPWVSPWPVDGPRKLKYTEPMYAASLIFWTYSDTLAIVLDCSSMNFSMCPVPIRSWYAIGEIEDGMGCLVYIDEPVNSKTQGVLKVWLLTRNTGGGITWECSGKQIPVRELLGADARVKLVVRVTNGLALLSFKEQYDQFVVDLNRLSCHAEFNFHGRPYAYQMAWPPAGLAALQEICKEQAQPVQLVLPVEPAPLPHDVDFAAPNNDVDVAALNDDVGLAAPLHDIDVAAPIDDVGLAAPLHDIDVAAPIDDVGLAALHDIYVAAPIDDFGLAALLHDIDVAAPIDDVGLAAPLHDGDAAAQIDDVACTEGPSDVVLRPLDDCGTERVIAAEVNNLVGTVEDGVALMQTLLRCEEKLQPSEDVPPEHKGQGPTTSHTRCNFDLDGNVLELVVHGKAHLQLAMDILSKVEAKMGTTGEARYSMIECPKSPITSEAIWQDQLQVPVLNVTTPEEFNVAVPDIAVSPTSSELRPPVLHPRSKARRLFISNSITVRHRDRSLETADTIILIKGALNFEEMAYNGFSPEVSKYFIRGFPSQWERFANSNMKQMNENTESPSKSYKYYIGEFLRGSYINSLGYHFVKVDTKSSKEPTGNTDGPLSQGLSYLSNRTPRIQEPSCKTGDCDKSVRKITPSDGLCNGRTGMPYESCEDHVPAETCSGNTDGFFIQDLVSVANGTPRNQEPSGDSCDYENLRSNTTASEGLCNGRMGMPDESFEDPIPGETCRRQTSQAAKPHELEKLAKGLNLAFGLIKSLEDNTGRTLRSGKVCGSNGDSFTKYRLKRKAAQQQGTLNMKVIPIEETTPPLDLTCLRNDGSVAQIAAPVKLLSKKGAGRPKKRARMGKGRTYRYLRVKEVKILEDTKKQHEAMKRKTCKCSECERLADQRKKQVKVRPM